MSNLINFGSEPIYSFNQPGFAFLSNFHPSPIEYLGHNFSTVEHAYQAAKCPIPTILLRFSVDGDIYSAGKAKRVGQTLQVRDGWTDIKVGLMLSLLRHKFAIDELKDQLLDTGDRWIEEGNQWGDKFWGISPIGSGNGQNYLGKLLMHVRMELQAGKRIQISL